MWLSAVEPEKQGSDLHVEGNILSLVWPRVGGHGL